MNSETLKKSIFNLAIQGKLVRQNPDEGTTLDLFKKMNISIEKLDLNNIEYPYEVPPSWEWIKLEEISEYIKAGGDKPKNFSKEKTKTYSYPVVGNGEKNDGLVGYTDKPKITENCITVSGRGTIGYSSIRNYPFTPIVRLLVIRLQEPISLKYVQIALSTLLEVGVGTSIKQLTVPMIKKKWIPLPPLKEQIRIVEKIEKLLPKIKNFDTLYKDVSKINNDFPEYFKKSILQYAMHGKLVKQIDDEKLTENTLFNSIIKPNINETEFPFEIPISWKWVQLGDIGDWGAGSTPPRSNHAYYGGNIPWIKTGDLNDSQIFSTTEYITEKALNETSVKLKPPGSVLIAMYGATIGKLGLLNIEATTNQACCACITSSEVYNKFLFYYLMSQRSSLIKMGSGGAQPNISKTKIVQYLFPLPPYKEQVRIVDKIEELFIKYGIKI